MGFSAQLSEEKNNPETPLLNAFNNTEPVSLYINQMMESDGDRNWANTRAAFNKLVKFRLSIEEKLNQDK